MARFKKNPRSVRKRTNITLDPDVWEDSQEICYAEGMSVSELINQLLKTRAEEYRKAERAAASAAKKVADEAATKKAAKVSKKR